MTSKGLTVIVQQMQTTEWSADRSFYLKISIVEVLTEKLSLTRKKWPGFSLTPTRDLSGEQAPIKQIAS